MQRRVPESVVLETVELVGLALHFPRSEIGTPKDPPDGLMISILDLGVLSRNALNEIECGFSRDSSSISFSRGALGPGTRLEKLCIGEKRRQATPTASKNLRASELFGAA